MHSTHRNRVIAAAVVTALGLFHAAGVAADSGDDRGEDNQVHRGFQVNPVPLDLAGRNRALVGLGSYIVNTSGCNDCHTHPSYLPGGDPFGGQPEKINAAQFLTGGRTFGPVISSANLTRDSSGRPAGLTLHQFKQTLRTGHNPLDPPGAILQVMPWPVIGKKTDNDLDAIYEYLSAIPSRPNNPAPGP